MLVKDVVDRVEEVSIPPFITKAIKIVFLILSLLYIIYMVDIRALVSAIHRLGWQGTVLLILLVGVQEVSTSYSLTVLVREQTDLNLWTGLKVDSIGALANSAIPSRAAALATVPVILKRITGVPIEFGFRTKAVQLSLIATYNGVITLVGVAMMLSELSESILIYVGAAMIYLAIPFFGLFQRWLPASFVDYLPEVISQLKSDTGNISTRAIAISSLCYLVFYATIPIRFSIITSSTGVNFWWPLLILIPIVSYSITIYPISFSGVGVAEASGIFVLTAVGVSPSIATTIIIVDRTVSAYLPLIFSYVITSTSLH